MEKSRYPDFIERLADVQKHCGTEFPLLERLSDSRGDLMHLLYRGVFRAKPKLVIRNNLFVVNGFVEPRDI